MAMTKKEQQAMKEAIERAELLAALRWTAPVDKDVPPPSGMEYTIGWTFNAYSLVVEESWSSSFLHGSGSVRGRHGSHDPIHMFSSKILALRAMRHAVENESAKKLMAIDRLIKAEMEN